MSRVWKFFKGIVLLVSVLNFHNVGAAEVVSFKMGDLVWLSVRTTDPGSIHINKFLKNKKQCKILQLTVGKVVQVKDSGSLVVSFSPNRNECRVEFNSKGVNMTPFRGAKIRPYDQLNAKDKERLKNTSFKIKKIKGKTDQLNSLIASGYLTDTQIKSETPSPGSVLETDIAPENNDNITVED